MSRRGSARVDATIIGAGPNGLAAAVILARAGLDTHVYEREATVGGGTRTTELTLPGFRHDECSAVHPLALASGFFRRFGLTERVDFVTPELSYAQPLDGGRAALAWRDLDRTAEGLGRDGDAWRRMLAPLVARADDVIRFCFSPVVGVPHEPVAAALVAARALEQGTPGLRELRFHEELAPALYAGVQAHASRRIPSLASAAAGVPLAVTAHARGWPVPIGGSQAIADAMAEDIVRHGGVIHTGRDVRTLNELPTSVVTLLDTTPRALRRMAGEDLPAAYARALTDFRYGTGAAKVDFALSGPVPWADPAVRDAGTVHLGGTAAAVAASHDDVARGRHSDDPYVLVSQPSRFDCGRAPDGQHVLWAYTHVPAGSTIDQTEAITRQIERFAPGFRDLILASSSRTAAELERHNPNYIGGDIGAGAASLLQLVRRPVLSPEPWRTPIEGVYLASASVSPGPGVHGLAGAYAARTALRDHFGIRRLPSLAPR